MESQMRKWLGMAFVLALCSGARELPAAPARIMPLGDSLTSSLDGYNSYRYPLWRSLTRSHYSFDFVGSQWGVGSGTQPKVEFDLDHEGHPGVRSDELELGVSQLAAAFQPDIVMLLIGCNDLDQGFTPAHVVEHVMGIVARLRAVNPRVVVLLGSCPPQLGLTTQSRLLHTALTKAVPKLTQKNSPVRLVNLYSGFSVARHTIDGYHLNAAGDTLMASKWAAALTPYLKNYKVSAAAIRKK